MNPCDMCNTLVAQGTDPLAGGRESQGGQGSPPVEVCPEVEHAEDLVRANNGELRTQEVALRTGTSGHRAI